MGSSKIRSGVIIRVAARTSIQKAGSIGRLPFLAFIFIPLSLVIFFRYEHQTAHRNRGILEGFRYLDGCFVYFCDSAMLLALGEIKKSKIRYLLAYNPVGSNNDIAKAPV